MRCLSSSLYLNILDFGRLIVSRSSSFTNTRSLLEYSSRTNTFLRAISTGGVSLKSSMMAANCSTLVLLDSVYQQLKNQHPNVPAYELHLKPIRAGPFPVTQEVCKQF